MNNAEAYGSRRFKLRCSACSKVFSISISRNTSADYSSIAKCPEDTDPDF